MASMLPPRSARAHPPQHPRGQQPPVFDTLRFPSFSGLRPMARGCSSRATRPLRRSGRVVCRTPPCPTTARPSAARRLPEPDVPLPSAVEGAPRDESGPLACHLGPHLPPARARRPPELVAISCHPAGDDRALHDPRRRPRNAAAPSAPPTTSIVPVRHEPANGRPFPHPHPCPRWPGRIRHRRRLSVAHPNPRRGEPRLKPASPPPPLSTGCLSPFPPLANRLRLRYHRAPSARLARLASEDPRP